MVQIIKGGTEQRKSQERLGYTVGKNISDMLMNFGANKALDSVINDETLKDAPMSDRMGKLQQALMPYGEKGLEVLQNRYQIEQQAQQEKQQKKMQVQQKKQSNVLGKLLNNQPVTEEERALLTPEQQIAFAKHQAAINKQPKPTQASQPMDPDQLRRIEEIEKNPAFKKATPSEKTSMLMKNGVSKENTSAVVNPFVEEEKIGEKRATREEAAFDRSYEAQKPFIDQTTKSYQGFETEMKPRLLQMQNIPDEDLVSPTQAVFLDALGIPLGALDNPGSELYNKLSQDLLKGLPETYGSRILKVEVDNFLKTIPTLLNSPDGRRMIASNMLKLGEMKEVFYNEMRREQKENLSSGKNFPKDFQQNVFDQVKPQIDKINNEFIKMSEVTSVPKGTKPYFARDGEIYFVPDGEAGQKLIQKEGLKRIW